MKIGFYTGSFDPFTNGHLNVVKKATEVLNERQYSNVKDR